MLKIRNLNSYYGKSHILQGIDLNINKGEIVSLLGRNGVGRSTVIKSIMGMVHSTGSIIFKHLLPNAMVATLTLVPFILTGSIGSLAALDFLGFGLPASYPSLGELTMQAKQNLQAPWLGLSAFFVFSIMLALLVFIFEGIRDAFDPRKTFV